MNTSLLKLRQLLDHRYGKGFELRPLMDMSKLNQSYETVVSGNDLYIPIIVKDQFLGAGVIPHGWELSEEKRKDVASLVRMVLEPRLYIEFLDRQESNLKGPRSQNDNTETMLTLVNTDQKVFTTSLLHLNGTQQQLLKKVALQIHDFSARWAFVPFDDVKNDIHTVMDICGLGGMTLYVQNIESLPAAYQKLLAEYTSSPRSLEEPLILTSSTIPLNELGQYIVSPGLLNDIITVHLEVDRAPLNSSIMREVVELVLNRDETQDLH